MCGISYYKRVVKKGNPGNAIGEGQYCRLGGVYVQYIHVRGEGEGYVEH